MRRVSNIRDHMQHDTTELLESQGVRIIRGTARFTSPDSVEVDTAEGVQQIDFDSALSRRVLVHAFQSGAVQIMSEFSPLETAIRLGCSKKVTVIGSGVTGVEFVHMFASFGAEVTPL